MDTMENKVNFGTVGLTLLLLAAWACSSALAQEAKLDGQAALEYLKALEGKWVIQGGDEGPFGWEFDVTSRRSVVVERLKVGTPTEMVTVYHLDDGTLMASHFCQLGNQPHLTVVHSEIEGDLHFECDGNLGGAETHAELHMHGVTAIHFEWGYLAESRDYALNRMEIIRIRSACCTDPRRKGRNLTVVQYGLVHSPGGFHATTQ